MSLIFFVKLNRRTTVVGWFVFVFVSEDSATNTPNCIYYADLEKNGEIRGKITLIPIFDDDLSSVFDVIRTTNIRTISFWEIHMNFFVPSSL